MVAQLISRLVIRIVGGYAVDKIRERYGKKGPASAEQPLERYGEMPSFVYLEDIEQGNVPDMRKARPVNRQTFDLKREVGEENMHRSARKIAEEMGYVTHVLNDPRGEVMELFERRDKKSKILCPFGYVAYNTEGGRCRSFEIVQVS